MDTVHLIKDDPKFGEKVYDACLKFSGTSDRVEVSGGAAVVACHHADHYVPIIIGNYTGIKLNSCVGWKQDKSEDELKLRVLKDVAQSMGYGIRKLPKR